MLSARVADEPAQRTNQCCSVGGRVFVESQFELPTSSAYRMLTTSRRSSSDVGDMSKPKQHPA